MLRNLFTNRPAILQKKRLRHSCFSMNFAKCFQSALFAEHFRATASECRNNIPRAFKAKFEENESNNILIAYLYILMASTYVWLNYNTSFHQTTSVCKNKAKPYQFISNNKAKIITLFDHEQLSLSLKVTSATKQFFAIKQPSMCN